MLNKILPALLLAPGLALANTCQPLSEYSVDGLSFNQQTAGQAFTSLLKNTPYQVSFRGVQPRGLVTAEDIAGPVNEVLNDLAAELDVSFTVDGCVITAVQRAAKTLQITAGTRVDISLQEWLQNNGYSLTWDATKVLAGGSLSLNKSIDDVLQDIVDLMKSNGIQIEVEVYENNAVRVLEIK